MTWQIFPNVTFTNGSKNIAVNDSTATAGILAGYAVNKDNKSYEIESITSSAIILVDAWAEATAANVKIKIQPTSEPIKEYIQETLGEVKGLVADYLARLQLEESIISSTGTVPFTDSAGVSHDIPGWGNLNSTVLNKIQEFGLGSGASNGSLPILDSINTDSESGFYTINAVGENIGKLPVNENFLLCQRISRGLAGQFVDIAFNDPITSGKSLKMYVRGMSDNSTGDWQEVFSDGGVEYGSNTNGEYWKYPDGKLVCSYYQGNQVVNTVLAESAGEAFQGLFPHAFILTPITIVEGYSSTSSGARAKSIVKKGNSHNATLWDADVVNLGTFSVTNIFYFSMLAIGRWK